jgi:hypothetical protein
MVGFKRSAATLDPAIYIYISIIEQKQEQLVWSFSSIPIEAYCPSPAGALFGRHGALVRNGGAMGGYAVQTTSDRARH